MFIAVFASLVATALAPPPIWWTGGQCGKSKYPDAGEYNLPQSFGIIGGRDARPYEFPWQVSFRNKSTNAHLFGGSIINERWVVTSAHCMVGMAPADMSIVVGESNMTRSSQVRQYHDVHSIFMHEHYNATRGTNDIAVVKVKVPFNFSVNVTPVCAPDPAKNYTYKKSQVSGWGRTDKSANCCPDTLRYTTLNITTNEYCDKNYITIKITDDMICAADNRGMTKRAPCKGDSGGPLTVKSVNGANGIFSLVGVISWAYGCADGYPDVCARVGYQATWITNKITNN